MENRQLEQELHWSNALKLPDPSQVQSRNPELKLFLPSGCDGPS